MSGGATSGSAVPGKPNHPHAAALADAMARANAYTDAGGSPIEALRHWVDPQSLMQQMRTTARARHGDAPRGAHITALGESAYLFGFIVGRLFKEPETTLTPSAQEKLERRQQAEAANPFLKPGVKMPSPPPRRTGSEDQARDLLSSMVSIPTLLAASNAVASRFQGADTIEKWDALVARDVDPASLRYAANQASYVLNGVVSSTDLARVQAMPDGLERLYEAVGMFLDGFLLAVHLSD